MYARNGNFSSKKKANTLLPFHADCSLNYFLLTTLMYSSSAMVIEGVPGLGA
jgi:hypothetical protein